MADFARSSCAAVQAQLDRMGGISGADDTRGLDRIAAPTASPIDPPMKAKS